MIQNVKKISFFKNGITKKETYLKAFSKSRAKNLEEINFEEEEIGFKEYDMKYISKGIITNFNLQLLNLQDNSIGKNKTDFLYLADILKENKNLKELYLGGNRLFENSNLEKFDSFCIEIESHKNLKKINIDGNSLINNVFDYCKFVESIERNETLEVFDCNDCDFGLSDFSIYAISNLLKNGNLRIISLASIR